MTRPRFCPLHGFLTGFAKNYSPDPNYQASLVFSSAVLLAATLGLRQKWSWGVIPMLQSTAAGAELQLLKVEAVRQSCNFPGTSWEKAQKSARNLCNNDQFRGAFWDKDTCGVIRSRPPELGRLHCHWTEHEKAFFSIVVFCRLAHFCIIAILWQVILRAE